MKFLRWTKPLALAACLTMTASAQNTPPEDTSIPGVVQQQFIYDEAPFPSCHASTICQTPDGFVAAWFGGEREGAKDVSIWVSDHDGMSWSAPRKVADGVQTDGSRQPCWNPVLFRAPSGVTWLFIKVGPNPKEWWGEVLFSDDGGKTFRDRTRLPEGVLGPIRCKPELVDGGKTLLCGSSTEHAGWRVHFERLTLTGQANPEAVSEQHWDRGEAIHDGQEFAAIQPTILRLPNDRLRTLCRTMQSVIVQADSNDNGRTWTKPVSTKMPNPNSGIDVITANDGRHWLISNPLPSKENGWGGRSQLTLSVSTDGEEYREVAVLENEPRGEFSYPAIIQAEDGKLHITYTWKRQKIKHVIFDPSAI
ncbi:sialidase family protein [Rhodopirellula sp. P2]|uniref:sialidase family protein n=1 Tax=Rhodopirellula sp. P2 TaxID=2127060 RepID=UPI002367EB38|nr:sialidase family protein [Rhodopirellula sp. P2]WDQ16055.1 exo-alpha-sialidase [Rhodopirellula sp. P2]